MELAQEVQARMTGLFPDTLGMHFTHASATCVRAELTVTKRLCTTDGILHGGVYMAFADTLGAVGTILNLPEDATTATTESKTNFFRPALMNSVVYGECTAVNMGRRLHTWQSHLTNSDGKLLAVITQTQMVIQAR